MLYSVADPDPVVFGPADPDLGFGKKKIWIRDKSLLSYF
jgi:hypothetical protein